MQANTTSPRLRVSDIASWMAAIFGVVLLLLLFLSFALETRSPATTAPVSTAAGRIAYFEFGLSADTLWLASTADPADKESLFTAPHAREFGVIPSLAPSGDAVAYTALPADTEAPGPDSPADLWYAELDDGAAPRLIAGDADLLVKPLWSPDASRLVYRHSNSAGYSLVEAPLDGAAPRTLVTTSPEEALFPVGFTTDGTTLYYVALSSSGSRLFALDTAAAAGREVARLSEGLTRDWALSPDASRLAYLALTYTPQAINSRAYTVDLATAQVEPQTPNGVSAFSPVWDGANSLLVGTLTPGGEGALLRIRDGVSSPVVSSSGLDVPLAGLPGGAYLVRAFEGASATAPGRASLTLVDSKGERHVLSTREVTLAGWSSR